MTFIYETKEQATISFKEGYLNSTIKDKRLPEVRTATATITIKLGKEEVIMPQSSALQLMKRMIKVIEDN